MIVLRPDQVQFGNQTWPAVLRVTVDRLAARTIEDYDETGPHLVFADVTRRKAVIRITQEITADELDDPPLGQVEQLTLIAGTGSDANRRRLTADAMVESVTSKVTDFGASRTITLTAVSPDAESDPITITAL